MLQLSLPEEFKTELQKTIGEAYKSALEEARRDSGLKEYLTKQQTMEYLSCANNTLMAMVETGLPMYRIGSKIYFGRKQINDYVLQHQV